MKPGIFTYEICDSKWRTISTHKDKAAAEAKLLLLTQLYPG